MTLNFSEIKQEKKDYLIQHGIEAFNNPSNDSQLVAKYGKFYSITIKLKLMANGAIHYVLRPTVEFLKAFRQHAEGNLELCIINDINSVVTHIKAIHKKYDELNSVKNEFSDIRCTECKTEAKVTNMRDVRIKKVIFNKPYTIVLWKDGSKTMIKCGENDVYDKEKGLALCISKKVYGNKYGWYDIFQKYVPELKEVKKDVKE